MIAILHPLPHVASHIVEAERIRLERSDGRGSRPLAAATIAIGIPLTDLVAPEIGSRAGASRVFPFRLGKETVGPAGHLREPRRILPGFIPTDVDDRPCCPTVTTVANVRASPYRVAGVPVGERHVVHGHGKGLGDRNRVLWAFIVTAVLLSLGRAHHELTGRDDDHPGAVLVAFPERIFRLQRSLAHGETNSGKRRSLRALPCVATQQGPNRSRLRA